MNSLFRAFISGARSLSLSLQRTFDHSYRQLIGVPTLRYSQITSQLYLGGQYSSRGFKILRDRGITAIINMRLSERKNLPDLGEVTFLHLPTSDTTAPSMTDLKKGVEFISKELEAKGKVYVHCFYGEGRGPSMVAAYLISTGLTVDDALKQIKEVRGFIKVTDAQLQRLSQFERSLQSPPEASANR